MKAKEYKMREDTQGLYGTHLDDNEGLLFQGMKSI